MAPQTLYTTEWIELYNPTGNSIDISGLYLDDVAAGGGAPKQIPASTSIASHGYYVMDIASGFLNNTGANSVRFLSIVGGVRDGLQIDLLQPGQHAVRQGVPPPGRRRLLVRHDFDQREQGHRQPEYLPLMRRRGAALGLLLVAGVISLFGLIALRPWEPGDAAPRSRRRWCRPGQSCWSAGETIMGCPRCWPCRSTRLPLTPPWWRGCPTVCWRECWITGRLAKGPGAPTAQRPRLGRRLLPA